MYSSFNNIFWGIILDLIDINIGFFDILPDFIGYGLIISGLSNLYKETKYKEFYISKVLSIVMLLQSIVGLFYRIDLMVEITYLGIVLVTVYQIIQILIVFNIYTGIINLLQSSNNKELRDSIILSRRNYVYIMMISTMLITFVPNMGRDVLSTLVIIMVIVQLYIVIRWAYNIRRVRNYYHMMD